MPKDLSSHLLSETRHPCTPMKAHLHSVVTEAARLAPSCDEKRLVIVSPASQLPHKPLNRTLREEEHSLLSALPNDLRLPSFNVEIAPVERQYL
jgi:hypothetical protein